LTGGEEPRQFRSSRVIERDAGRVQIPGVVFDALAKPSLLVEL
jgi:hypothetical protein